MIDPVVGAVVSAMAAPVVAFYGLAVSRHRARQRTWREAAHRARLSEVEGHRAFLFAGVSAKAGAMRVRLDSYHRSGRNDGEADEAGTRITVESGASLTLRHQQDGSLGMLWQREVETGDEVFDNLAWILGAPGYVRAVLDVGAREEIGGLLQGGIRIDGLAVPQPVTFWMADGRLVATLQDVGGDLTELLASAVRTLVRLAGALQLPEDVPRRIADNTAREPMWTVRLQNLRFLAESFPRAPATREAALRCREDERTEVQLAAALCLRGEESRPLLLEIASREWSDDASAARAVGALGALLPAERAQAILQHALRTRRVRTAQACMKTLGLTVGAQAVPSLARVLAVEGGELGESAAVALGSCGPEAEAPLLRALEDAVPRVREAAARALGAAGSQRALLALKEVATSGGESATLRALARHAVAEIQARSPGATPGQLSLSGGEEGQVSLADQDPRGRVSLPKSR